MRSSHSELGVPVLRPCNRDQILRVRSSFHLKQTGLAFPFNTVQHWIQHVEHVWPPCWMILDDVDPSFSLRCQQQRWSRLTTCIQYAKRVWPPCWMMLDDVDSSFVLTCQQQRWIRLATSFDIVPQNCTRPCWKMFSPFDKGLRYCISFFLFNKNNRNPTDLNNVLNIFYFLSVVKFRESCTCTSLLE